MVREENYHSERALRVGPKAYKITEKDTAYNNNNNNNNNTKTLFSGPCSRPRPTSRYRGDRG